MEAAELALFMAIAGAVTVLFAAPGSPLTVRDAVLRRLAIGACIGLTATAIIYSPLGRRSGAHLNPAVTLTFLRLHLVKTWDAVFYVAAQFAGAVLGVSLATATLGSHFSHAPVSSIATLPGTDGVAGAFLAETAISFILMSTVLAINSHKALSRFAGVVAGGLLVVFIVLEAPYSGMSMNPARTFGSGLWAAQWQAWWVYFAAPVLGMSAAAEVHLRLLGGRPGSASLHGDHRLCIFHCADHGHRPMA